MSKHSDKQRAIHYYRQKTGRSEVDMHEVARFAVEKLGMKLPAPVSPMDSLARQMARAARDETRYDAKTGQPYRVNHAFNVKHGEKQLTLWVDIDTATRKQMHMSLQKRREQMVGDAVQLTFDADHWNSINPTQEPIELPLDLAPDVEWAKNTPNEDAAE